MLQVGLKKVWSQLDAVAFDALFELRLVVLLLFVTFPRLLLKNQIASLLQLLVRLQKQSFHADIAKAQMHPLDSGQAQYRIKFLVDLT
jgi:hypothetical protein